MSEPWNFLKRLTRQTAEVYRHCICIYCIFSGIGFCMHLIDLQLPYWHGTRTASLVFERGGSEVSSEVTLWTALNTEHCA
jgi:hypothetical protein